MKKLLLASTMLFALASGAQAATLSPANVGQVATIQYSGTTPDGNQSADVTATQVITLDSYTAGTNIYSFSYNITNTSDISTRLVGFGFDTAPELAGATATGLFNQIGFTQSISGGVNVDVCFSTNNCSGGGGTGLLSDASTTGTFTLDFADGLIGLITVDQFTARFQSIVGSPFGTSGIAGGNPGGGFINPTVVVPGPAVGAGLPGLLALGLLGFNYIRRRRLA